MLKFPFEVPFEEVLKDPDIYVSSVFSCLESEFLVMPKGPGFVDYATFENGYETLKKATSGFSHISAENIYPAILSMPISIVVLRSMLGFTPPEWAYITTQHTGVNVSQGFARSLDRKIRMMPEKPLNTKGITVTRLRALVETACELLVQGAPEIETDKIHRLNKADTKTGQAGV